MIQIAIFCSGSGSNAEALMAHFHHHRSIQVAALVVNNPRSYAINRAEKFGVEGQYFSRNTFVESPDVILQYLKDKNISFILLAGFLQLIPEVLISNFPDRILNIHPALLPSFGGPGMYGHFVHEAVKSAGVSETGLTIHLVDEEYDKGKIIFQATCRVEKDDSAADIAARVLVMEHIHYPLVAEYVIQTTSKNDITFI
ncbi:MAG TPA: phosphoribosylglycinamide formyltransferase [Catalimonadaceae bacterium]|nr:phosphoribosylglycinamide formyltransferase [Catalimonadaceae bacterium]HPI11163.1 phosphoribosylglycinamide formyltransferase [Catalimonadaceae bacterium]